MKPEIERALRLAFYTFLAGVLMPVALAVGAFAADTVAEPLMFAVPCAILGAMLALALDVVTKSGRPGAVGRAALGLGLGGLVVAALGGRDFEAPLTAWLAGGLLGGVGLAWGFAKTPRAGALFSLAGGVALGGFLFLARIPTLDCPV
ncbi:MAG TPA: hypothetical protein ENK43_03260 [Planctomycetes bacterium]|nr:hypothetical protein [Planctomycetota bacterium]